VNRTLWRVLLAGGPLLVGLWWAADAAALREWLWIGLVGGACVGVLTGIRVHRPSAPGPWLVLAWALGLLTVNNVLLHPSSGAGPGLIVVADALELVAFPLFGAAALWMLRRQLPGGDREGAMDGAIVMVALATVLAGAILIDASTPTGPLDAALRVIAPLVIAGVTAASIRLLFTGGTPAIAAGCIVASTTSGLVGHVLRTSAEAGGTYARGGVEDLCIAGAYLFAGLAAAHPSMARLTDPSPGRGSGHTHARIALLGGALLGAPATLVLRGSPAADATPVTGGVVVSLLVLWQLWHLVLERERVRDDLRHRAGIDALTGLANRSRFVEQLGGALARAERSGGSVAVAFVDLDGFKRVNDEHGHAAGDELLRQVADRLRSSCREGDLAARFAGDEFVVLAEGLAEDDVSPFAGRLLGALRTLVPPAGTPVAASLGITLHTGAKVAAEALLSEADAAMYQAKARGGDGWAWHDADLGARLQRRRVLTTGFPEALAAGAVELHHQPIVRLLPGGERRVVGFEALLRWTHPDLGPVPPPETLGIADAAGLVGELTARVLRGACEAVAAARRLQPEGELRAFVNVSPRELANRYLPALVADALEATGARPADIVVEVTEDALWHDRREVDMTLRTLRGMGIGIALDDFGTGYSSLAHLRTLPLDVIKIDRSFVAGIASAGPDRAIVEAIVAMAGHLGAEVVAEGVEQEWQLAAVGALGCDLVQGYLLGRPEPGRHRPTGTAPVEAVTSS
jgi:diguanylate cyclase (GGDEF)-like protein